MPVPSRATSNLRGSRPSDSETGTHRIATSSSRGRDSARVTIGGVSISHPDRLLQPTDVTKCELADYYVSMGERMLPHVLHRPLTLLRWSGDEANDKGGIYLRHARAWGPKVLRRVQIQEKTKVGEYLVIDDPAGLIALAQMSILEIHTWNATHERLEYPDRMIFDLDPAPDVPWSRVIEAALHLRSQLKERGLASWPKTTGGKGLHLVVPLRPVAGWDSCFGFCRDFAHEMVRIQPKQYVAEVSKTARKGKILIDYLRNGRTNTSVAAFSTRAKAHTPVSVPITWKEVEAGVRSDAFTVHNLAEHFGRKKRDPWAKYWTCSQQLPNGYR